MRGQLVIKIFLSLFLAVFTLKSYAIRVNVQASGPAIAALGFAANGKNHGGTGRTYNADNMPTGGTYIFGIRVNGIFGTDVTCYVKGKKTVVLNNDTTASLNYDGKRCTANLR